MRCPVAVMLGLLAPGLSAASPVTSGSFTNEYGTLSYELHVPSGHKPGEAAPLLVALHGCLQSPEQLAGVARLNELADAEKILVLYPSQGPTANPARCWNWFDTANQERGAGEPSLIKGMIDDVRAKHAVDASRIYVAGLSAGGFMTNILLSCYPDVFAAGAIVAGGIYKAAVGLAEGMSVPRSGSPHDPQERGAQAWKCSGEPSPHAFPVLVIDGDADTIVGAANAPQVVAQFAQMNDYGDDGQDNDSVKSAFSAGTRARSEGRLEYTCRELAAQRAVLVRHCTVHGLGHAWSGGDAKFPYAEPKGPDATAMMWSFLKEHARRSAR